MAKATVLFCDDIRREASGKEILIGVYGSNLIPPELPTTLFLAIWVRVEGVHAPVTSFSFEIENASGRSLAKFAGKSSSSQPPTHQTFMASLNALPVPVEGPDTLVAWVSVNGERLEAGRLIIEAPDEPSS